MSRKTGVAKKKRQPRFTVFWEMTDVEADTPRKAAEQCLKLLQEPGTPCTFFRVKSNRGKWHAVDLDVAED